MTSIDTNLLFYALQVTCPEHTRARDFLNAQTTRTDFALCELVLTELYVQLRNPATARQPLTPEAAVALIQRFRTHPTWSLLDYPGYDSGAADALWQHAAAPQFARRRIYDARLALTLRHHGVTEFATANVKDFADFGFTRVWNPLA
ncbi:MAG: PIN domain-containing protein [Verrucomicrobia bacterium]|nr:PIN domain-containing protein [Verrucomicrobiota bacterium]